MRHDVIVDRYGRLYELPYHLSRIGHQITGLVLSYRENNHKEDSDTLTEQSIEWVTHDVNVFVFPSILTYLRKARELCQGYQPDLIFASSDCLHIVFAAYLSRKYDIPFAADLYDNYESFGMCHIPFLKYYYRRALNNARFVTTVSDPLNEHIRANCSCDNVSTLESTIDPDVFHKIPRYQAREALELPVDKLLVGVSGALDASRGIHIVYSAMLSVLEDYPGCMFVIAGTADSRIPVPQHPGIRYLGRLPHSSMPDFYSAMDISILPMANSDFGRYAFPQKAYEILASGSAPVFADVGSMSLLLKKYQECLYTHNSISELYKAVTRQIENPVIPDIMIPSWAEQAVMLDGLIERYIQRTGPLLSHH